MKISPLKVISFSLVFLFLVGCGGSKSSPKTPVLTGTANIYNIGSGPHGIAIDSAGDVWVSNPGSDTVGVAKGPQYFQYTGPIWPGDW